MKTLDIEILNITQEELRYIDELAPMSRLVREGGGFSIEEISLYGGKSLIQLIKMPDGEYYIRDGHHRILSVLIGGRDYLYNFEYEIVEYTYEDLSRANIKTGWITPFDLKTEVRAPDLFHFKEEVAALSPKEKEKFILANRDRYAIKRKMGADATAVDLYVKYNDQIKEAINTYYKNHETSFVARMEGFLTSETFKFQEANPDATIEQAFGAGFIAASKFNQMISGVKEVLFCDLEVGEQAMHHDYGTFKKISFDEIEIIDPIMIYDEDKIKIEDVEMICLVFTKLI